MDLNKVKFSNQRRGTKYLNGFKDCLKEVVFQLKMNRDCSVQQYIDAFEYAIQLLEKEKK